MRFNKIISNFVEIYILGIVDEIYIDQRAKTYYRTTITKIKSNSTTLDNFRFTIGNDYNKFVSISKINKSEMEILLNLDSRLYQTFNRYVGLIGLLYDYHTYTIAIP